VTAVDGLQRTLAAEHAAMYVFGVLGGRAANLGSPVLRKALATAYDVHRTRRDRLESMIRATGGSPVAAEPGYAVPHRLASTARVTASALGVERACTTTYAALVGETTGAQRRWAIRTLAESAVSEIGFGGRAEPLPGVGTTN
jgi:hypothetical protein